MYCRNCGHDSPEGVMICEECGADLGKRLNTPESSAPRSRTTSFSSCLVNLFSYLIIFLLVLLTIAAVAAFTCIFEIPEVPESGYPGFVLTVWNEAEKMQDERCADKGYAEDLAPKGTEEDPRVQLEIEAEEEPACGQPTIRIEPTIGVVGTTFDIFLEGFSANDEIEACWYFPDESLINCADLDADENGDKKTRFWSEKNDPTGIYSMEAVGACSRAEAIWDILPKDN